MPSNRIRRKAELNRQLRQVVIEGGGVVTLDELRTIGFSRSMIRRRTEVGYLIPVLPGAYTLPGASLVERGRWRAAVYAGGAGSCLSHRSALALHGLVRDKGPIHITRKSGPKPTARTRSGEEFGIRVVCHQTRVLPADHLVVVRNVRATTVERSLRDFAAYANRAEISKVLSQGERERNLCWRTLAEVLDQSNGQRGVGLLRSEVARWDPAFADAWSDPEEKFLLMIQRQGLPIPKVNVLIEPYIVDFYWPELKLVVELDPYGTHNGRESFHRDRRKSLELEVRGLRVVRIAGDDLRLHEDRMARELRAIMEEQARLHGATRTGS